MLAIILKERNKKNKAGDFQEEGSECSPVNFGHIVLHYRWDLTISWNKQGRI